MLRRDLCNNPLVNSRNRVLIVVAIVGIVLSLRFRPRPLTEEERIRRAFADAREAVEGHSVRDLMRFIADDYSDNEGNSKQMLRQIATAYLMQRQHLSVGLMVRKVEVQNDATATANVHVIIADRDSGRGDMDLQLELAKDKGAWKVVRASGVNASGG